MSSSRWGDSYTMGMGVDDGEEYPAIRVSVQALEHDGAWRYVEVADWFKDAAAVASPEGHRWGASAHATLEKELARVIRESVAAQTP